MCQRDGIRHQFGSLVGRITEHHTLISGTDGIQLLIGHMALTCFQRLVNAHGDICGLLVQRYHNRTGIAVESFFGRIVADLGYGLTNDSGNINICLGGDLTHDQYETGIGAGLTCYTAEGILLHQRIQYRIRYGITDFVGMSFGYGLRCK